MQVFLNDNQLAAIAGYELAPQRVAAGFERLTAIAKAAKAAGDTRRMDQLRADALLDLLVGDGVAAGGPITDSGIDNPSQPPGQAQQPAADPADPVDPADPGVPWPLAPADATLLDPTADPAQTTPPPPVEDLPLPEQPPDEPDPGIDLEQDHLHRFFSAGFHHLPTTGPGCPRCRTQPAGAMPAPRRGVLDIQIALTTLAGLDELPAKLAGFGPLLADAARQTIIQNPDLQWRFSVYNELHELVAHGITHQRPTPTNTAGSRRTKRRPTAQVAAHVRARNRTCVAPGCRIPSRHCDLDHTLAWEDHGETEPANLGPGCRGHHLLKHAAGTDLTQWTPGYFGWTTPRGMQYLTRPSPPLYADPPPTVINHHHRLHHDEP